MEDTNEESRRTDIVKYPRSKQLSSENQIQLLYRLIVRLKHTGEYYVFITF